MWAVPPTAGSILLRAFYSYKVLERQEHWQKLCKQSNIQDILHILQIGLDGYLLEEMQDYQIRYKL